MLAVAAALAVTEAPVEQVEQVAVATEIQVEPMELLTLAVALGHLNQAALASLFFATQSLFRP
jgi:hypothetical protein